jgi:hypothetical protein
MHNLDETIALWRQAMTGSPKLNQEAVDELESHLRDKVDELIRSGMPEPTAFQEAVNQLGDAPELAREFQKLEQSTWLPVKVITVVGIAGMLACATLVLKRYVDGRLSLLLATHVYAITLGYTAIFLNGALGVCFVGQRCLSDLSAYRVRSLARYNLVLGWIATLLTGVGIILGMVWTKIEWGRYWDWDIKETGGFCVMVWLASFLVANRLAGGSRRVLIMSVLGNVVVSLAWFGAHMLSKPDGVVNRNYWLVLLVAVLVNFVLFFIGFAPAGWLRPRKL